MIMLVTTSPRARECAAAMEQATHQKTEIAASLARAVERLQSNDYDLLVLDESFNHTEIGGVNLLLSHAGAAMPVYVNLALHGMERVAREVQSGLARFVRERLSAMQSAENLLRNVVRGEVTAILLNSELAMRAPALCPEAAEKIQLVQDLAETMRRKLEVTPAHVVAARSGEAGHRTS
jgi:DNA-binding NtrC family response regulator